MTAYLIERIDYARESEPVVWRTTLEAAERWITEHPPTRDEMVDLWMLNGDGTVEHVEWYEHIPEPYRGPLVKVTVPVQRSPLLRCHRVPIDCQRPQPYLTLTEDRLLRVVANSCCGTDPNHETAAYFHCHCGEWQEIEGSPEAVARLEGAA